MNKFKNTSGAYLTLSLFYETSREPNQVLYTLKDRDHLGYPSLYRLYMETNDPTEYQFAIRHLDSWAHWLRISTAAWFKEYVTAWRKELELRTRSEALLLIRAVAGSEGKEAFQANKYLLNGMWKEKDPARRRGAPSKQEIREAANEMVTADQILTNDLERIKGLN
jgi:hypothetical protein